MAAKKDTELLKNGETPVSEEKPVRKRRTAKKSEEPDVNVSSDTPVPEDSASEVVKTKKRATRKKKSEDVTENTAPALDVNSKKKVSDADAPVSEASDTSAPAQEDRVITIDFFNPGIKLTRKRGQKVSKKAESQATETAVESTDENQTFAARVIPSLSQPAMVFDPNLDTTTEFKPKALAKDPPVPKYTVGRYDPYFVSGHLVRKKGAIYSRIDLDARLIRYSGMIRNAVQDRAPVLQDVAVIEEMLTEPCLAYRDYLECANRLYQSETRHDFDRLMADTRKWNLVVNWYGVKPELVQFVQNVEDEAQEDAVVSDANEAQPGDDPAVTALFELFERPIEAMRTDSTDPEEIRIFHSANHAGRITSLFADWARALEYIDLGVFGGPKQQPLSVCFIERFQQILITDFESAKSQGVMLPDEALRNRFLLDDIDLLLLWFMAGHEMDPKFRLAMRSTWDQQTVIYMNASTLMRFFCLTAFDRADVMGRLSPSSVMATAGLFKIIQGNVPTQPLVFEIVVSEQIVRQFMGIRSLSVASTQYAELLFPHLSEDTFIAESHAKTFDILRNYLDRPRLNVQPNLERENLDFIPSMAFLIEGLPGSGRTTLVKILASRFKRPLIIVQSSPLVGIHPTDCEEYLKSLFTDAALMNAFVCFRDAGPLLTEERLSAVFARQLALRPIVCAFCVELAVKIQPVIEPYVTFKTKMDANLRDSAVSFWNQHLRLPFMDSGKIDVKALSERMALQPFQIQKATKLAYYSKNIEAEPADAANAPQKQASIPVTNTDLEKAAAIQVTKNIGNLAFVSDPEIDLSDVIVSDDIMEKITHIIGSAKNRRRVLYEWGLSKRIRRGTGVIALFDGEPGTGKTHSAEAIAHELGLSLMRINIATMVDKYIGETEKNLTTIFEQARPDMQLLLFDEADSLFTKRTANVSKSNDRYSNMSVNVLLQLVERYEGVSILTTNLKNAIDPAFERRITYKVYFPMPKKPERERLWKYMCPPEIKTAEPIDYEWLSDLEMSGGEIKNAVLTAAFTAATEGVLLDSAILYNAGVSQAVAAGRVLRHYEDGDDFI